VALRSVLSNSTRTPRFSEEFLSFPEESEWIAVSGSSSGNRPPTSSRRLGASGAPTIGHNTYSINEGLPWGKSSVLRDETHNNESLLCRECEE